MKKLLALLLTVALVFGVAACSDKKQNDKKSTKTEQTSKDNNAENTQPDASENDETSGEQIIEKTVKELEKVDSAHMLSYVTTKYSVLGTDVDMKVDMEGDVDVANGTTYMKATTQSGDTAIDSDIYIQTKDGTTDVYMSSNGIWIKQTGIPESEIYKLGNGYDGLNGIIFYLEAMEDTTVKESSDGKSYVISGVIGSSSVKESLEKSGFSSMLSSLDESGEFSKDEIEGLLDNLNPMKFTATIDKETYFVTELTGDMKDTIDTIYKNLNVLAKKKYGEEFTYTIHSSKYTVNLSKYNETNEIVIPDEAKSGTEYTIIP